jgi:hypothetical protein
MILFETHVRLFHNQTKTTDGSSAGQSEGWPTGGSDTKPRWNSEQDNQKQLKNPHPKVKL